LTDPDSELKTTDFTDYTDLKCLEASDALQFCSANIDVSYLHLTR